MGEFSLKAKMEHSVLFYKLISLVNSYADFQKYELWLCIHKDCDYHEFRVGRGHALRQGE